jgi:hypothetical protein
MRFFPCSAAIARRTLVLGWFASFLASLAMLLYLYLGDWIVQDNFKDGLSQLSTLYAPYLGAMLAFYFSMRKKAEQAAQAAGMAFALACTGSVIWNLGILISMARVVLLWGRIEPAVKDIALLGSTLSWVVAPAMGFYFANPFASGARHED